MKKVSVIIPVYNGEEFIGDAINSVLAQTYDDYEIIVIDDGSIDNTKRILDQFAEKITYIYQSNQGVAVARNTGIKATRGKYIAFLDADDIWFKNKLKLEVEILENNPDIDLVHANDVKISSDKKILRGYTRNKKNLDGYLAKGLILRKFHIQISTVLIRRKCIEKYGLFDPNLSKLGAEDREFFYRITKKCKAKYINKDVSYYRVSSNSLSANRQNMLDGHKYILDKHFPKTRFGFNLTRRRILSSLHLEEGKRISWKTTNYNLSNKEFLLALKYFPFDLRIYANLLKTILKIVLNFCIL